MAIQPLRLDPITVLGKQLVIELFDCVDQRFDDIQWIEESMLEAARRITPPSSPRRSTSSARSASPAWW